MPLCYFDSETNIDLSIFCNAYIITRTLVSSNFPREASFYITFYIMMMTFTKSSQKVTDIIRRS